MQRAKTFLCVSLGMLALSVAFHLGARSAQGQSGQLEVGHISIHPNGTSASGLDASGRFRLHWANNDVWIVSDLPKTGRVIATASDAYHGAVLYDDGEFYSGGYVGGGELRWILAGNVFESPVQTKATTWGRVKAERR